VFLQHVEGRLLLEFVFEAGTLGHFLVGTRGGGSEVIFFVLVQKNSGVCIPMTIRERGREERSETRSYAHVSSKARHMILCRHGHTACLE
jgi:hypothetical protein